MERKINIGLTFFFGGRYNNIWSNGTGQTLFFMTKLLKQIPFVNDVFFVYAGEKDRIKEISPFLETEAMGIKFYTFEEALDLADVIVEGTSAVHPGMAAEFRKRGTKLITFRMGTDFLIDQEAFLYDKGLGRSFNGVHHDAIWLLPQIADTNTDYVEIMMRQKSDRVPFIWDPFFVDNYSKNFKRVHPDFTFTYQPGATAKRISVFEQNLSVCKSSYMPILISEAAYRQDKSAIKHVYLCNTVDKKDKPVFHNFIGRTDLVLDDVMTVEACHVVPKFLGIYTDIVVSNNWELGLNNIYAEILYGEYPLIHNSKYLKEAGVGFYYENFNARAGAAQLLEAIYHYDEHIEEHRAANRAYLERLSPLHKENVKAFEELLLRLFKD